MSRRVITFLNISFCILLETLLGSAKAASNGGEEFYFAFRSGSDVYEKDLGTNRATFRSLSECVNDAYLTNSNWYLHIEVFITRRDEERLQVLNQKLFRAAIMRSQLKSVLKVPYDRIAFSLSRSAESTDEVCVTLFDQPMPRYTNRDIFYSLSSLPADISRALSRYEQLPFSDSYRSNAGGFPVESTVVAAKAPRAARRKPASSRCNAAAPASTPVSTPASKSTSNGNVSPVAYPLNLAVKTNILPWMGVVPVWGLDGKTSDYGTGALMYNGALEYYFSDSYSVEASFLYSYAPYGGNKNNLWGISSFALSPRFWLNQDNSFRKFHIGMRAEYGDFDIKNNKPANYGKTGRFYSMSFAMGYVQPIYRNFLFEAGLSLGYRNIYDGKNYRYDLIEKKKFYEDGFTQGQFVIGVSVGLMYRFGFW